jgi:hypothetical protein
MNSAAPTAILAASAAGCRAMTRFHRDSLLLECLFEPAHAPSEAVADLRRRVDITTNVRPQERRIVLGDVDVLFDENGDIASIELRTDLDQAEVADMPDLKPEIPEVRLDLDVEVDPNGIATVDLPVEVQWSPRQRRVAVRFAGGASGLSWYALADTVAVGVDERSGLRELRFDRVAIADDN